MRIEIPEAFSGLLEPHRYKIFYGGRGAARSWTFARALVGKTYERPLRVGCFREYQTNIQESVHQVLVTQIDVLGVHSHFDVTKTGITSSVGGEFIFKGFLNDPDGIKSLEGLDIAWVEEAHTCSKKSLDILRPTLRKPGSELWFSMNTGDEDDPIYQMMIAHPLPGSLVKLVTYRDNPWFPDELEEERKILEERDPDSYDNIWEGKPLRITEAQIFRNRVVIEPFEASSVPGQKPRFYFGLDFGFANDPLALVRFWITGMPPYEELWIDYENFGNHVELDDTPDFIRNVPEADSGWPICADNARPESISYLCRQGLAVHAAEKWNGSVEDGIAHLKAYKKIHLHPRCRNLAREFRLYSYKVDKKTDKILPIIIDANNHGIDALRYGHDGLIQRRGGVALYEKLAED